MKLNLSVLIVALSQLAFVDAHPKIHTTDDKVDDAYIVVFNEGAATADAFLADYPDIEVTATYKNVYDGFAATMTLAEAEAIADSPLVKYVAEDGMAHSSAVMDPWGIDRVDQRDLPFDDAYNPAFGNGGEGVTAYIIDTGIRITHEQFDGRATWGVNYADSLDEDCGGHGTHVAGTVGGNTMGVAPKTDLVAVKVLGCAGWGYWSWVISGMEWVMNDAKGKKAVSNMSLGGGKNTGVNDAATALYNSGVPTIVAAGNDDNDACGYSPASADGMITVASTDDQDERSWFSNYGSGCTHIFAPGSAINSSLNYTDDSYGVYWGTSMAAPHVAGAAALHLNEGVGAFDVANKLYETATPDKIGDDMNTPNLLLYVGGGDGPPPSECTDSPMKFKFEGRKKTKKLLCETMNIKKCKKFVVKSFCPDRCGECERFGCKNAQGTFYFNSEELTCGDVTNKLCRNGKIKATCRKRCKFCD